MLDLGTNTFQLLIAERLGDAVTFLHDQERWVYLAEDGIERIGDNALQRMNEVLQRYKTVVDKYEPEMVVANGTAAFRRATNRKEAIALVDKYIGVTPQIISGDEEATLIYEGVSWVARELTDVALVMDIGGGSTEFIIGKGNEILWKKSYPLGATLLRQMFHRHEPITSDEQLSIQQHVLQTTLDLQDAVKQFQPAVLIGASGSFDSFVSMLMFPQVPANALVAIDKNELNGLVDRLCSKNKTQRAALNGLVHYRVGPIVTAGVLTRTVVEMLNVKTIYRSAYALKEGLMRRLL